MECRLMIDFAFKCKTTQQPNMEKLNGISNFLRTLLTFVSWPGSVPLRDYEFKIKRRHDRLCFSMSLLLSKQCLKFSLLQPFPNSWGLYSDSILFGGYTSVLSIIDRFWKLQSSFRYWSFCQPKKQRFRPSFSILLISVYVCVLSSLGCSLLTILPALLPCIFPTSSINPFLIYGLCCNWLNCSTNIW